MNTINKDIVIESFRGSLPASEFIEKVKTQITPETLNLAGDCVKEVEEHIKKGKYNLLLFTGRSGFIADKLISDDLKGVNKAWIEDQNQRYNDPHGIELMLDELGINPEKCQLLIVDDHISSGIFKARNSLLGLSKTVLKKFGFASFVGPVKYHKEPELQKKDIKTNILEKSTHLSDKLFFPDLKNQDVWQLLRNLGKLAKYYEKSTMIRDFIDTTISQIKKTKEI